MIGSLTITQTKPTLIAKASIFQTGPPGPPGPESVTSVAITGAGGISFAGSPITTSGTFAMSIDAPALRTTLGVAPAPTSGNATTGQTVLGDDTRLSDARSPLAHGHAISDITGLSDGLGTISVLNASIAGVFTFAFGVSYAYQTGAAADHRRALAGDSIVTEAADFTLSEATHGSRYTRLTKTGSTQVITLPTDPTAPDFTTGAEFGFYRATTQALAFSGGTVNGAANLASVPVNGAFALKYLGSGTYDFI